MTTKAAFQLPKTVALLLVFGRAPLVFAGMMCAIAVMLNQHPMLYTLGVSLLVLAMSFDLVDGWFSERFHPDSKLAHVADRLMDRVVFSIVFPLIAVGMMWRFHFVSPTNSRPEFLHVVFVLLLCITVLLRDNFAHFMRSFASRLDPHNHTVDLNRLRTMVATPIAALLYAHAFYVPEGPESHWYYWVSWLGNIPLRVLFFVEITFFIINVGSIASLCRRYGSACLDALCLGDRVLRHRILSFFPNALTVTNALMGGLAVLFTQQGSVREAYLILLGAAIFDKLDGTVARKLGLTKQGAHLKKRYITFGGILDDIADMISFCITPAIMLYLVLHDLEVAILSEQLLVLLCVAYSVAGIARLVYFTFDRSPIPGFFKGMPTPAAALLVAAPLCIIEYPANKPVEELSFWGMMACAVFGVSILAMNAYPIRYLHFGRLMGRHPSINLGILLSAVTFFFTPYFGHAALFFLSVYLISPLFTWHIDPDVAARETVRP